MSLQTIQNQIIQFDFLKAYEYLKSLNYDFCFENITRDFKKVDSVTMYAFMMFVISQEEDATKHITICNYLYFMNPYINGADQIIRWHVLRALEMFPQSISMIHCWARSIYDGNPDCPFTDAEWQKIKSNG